MALPSLNPLKKMDMSGLQCCTAYRCDEFLKNRCDEFLCYGPATRRKAKALLLMEGVLAQRQKRITDVSPSSTVHCAIAGSSGFDPQPEDGFPDELFYLVPRIGVQLGLGQRLLVGRLGWEVH